MRNGARLTAVLCAAVLAAGCGSGSSDSAGEASGEPQDGGVLTVQQPFEPTRGLNFLVSDDPSLMQILSGTVYEKLVEIDPEGEGIQLEPALATEWTVSDDGLTYTFTLRDDVTWQDVPPVNGRPFTSDDVVATFMGLKESQSTHKWMVEPLESVTAPDDTTAVFTLSRPYAPFLDYLAHHFNVVLPREGVEGQFDMATTAIGTGPFMVESHQQDVEWVLAKNPDYYVEGKPHVDEIRMPVISDTAAVTAALRSGRLDIGLQPFDVADRTFEGKGGFSVLAQPWYPVSFYLNSTAAPFDDLAVRRAVMMAVDWDGMGENIRGEYERMSLLRPDVSAAALSGEEIAELTPYDPDAAEQLLADAGYADGFSTEFVVQQLSEADVRQAQWIAEDLKKIGIDAEIVIADPGTAINRRRNHEFGMAMAVRGTIFNDQALQDYRSDSIENYAGINDPKVDELIQASRIELDDEARAGIYRELQEYMETEVSAASLPIQTYQFFVTGERVHGYGQSPIYQGSLYADVWVTD